MPANVEQNKSAILEARDQRSLRVDSMPFYYHVHLFMPCNQKCIMCVPDGKHPSDMLSFDDFLKFFEDIKPYAEHLTLIGGEPLLYPWINDVLDLLSQHEIAVTINTNCTSLKEDLCRRLTSLHELHLKCSIDAMTRETYYRIRGTDVFERVAENMKRFSTMAAGMPNMHQIPVYIVMRENLHEVLPFVDFAKPLAPQRIEFHPVRHVSNWVVENDTGWTFDGKEQSCESFREEYNDVMRQAAEKCKREKIRHEVLYL